MILWLRCSLFSILLCISIYLLSVQWVLKYLHIMILIIILILIAIGGGGVCKWSHCWYNRHSKDDDIGWKVDFENLNVCIYYLLLCYGVGGSSRNYCFQTIDAEQLFILNVITTINDFDLLSQLIDMLSLMYIGLHALLRYCNTLYRIGIE